MQVSIEIGRTTLLLALLVAFHFSSRSEASVAFLAEIRRSFSLHIHRNESSPCESSRHDKKIALTRKHRSANCDIDFRLEPQQKTINWSAISGRCTACMTSLPGKRVALSFPNMLLSFNTHPSRFLLQSTVSLKLTRQTFPLETPRTYTHTLRFGSNSDHFTIFSCHYGPEWLQRHALILLPPHTQLPLRYELTIPRTHSSFADFTRGQ